MFQNLIVSRDKKAIQYGESVYSYNQLLQHSQLYANYMKSICTEGLDRVMFFSKNAPEYIFALYGTFRCGAVTIPVDVTSGSKELTYIVNDARPQIIYTTIDNVATIQECVAELGDSTYTPHIFTQEDIDVSEVESIEATQIAVGGADDVATIIYTSGTTGSPKGVMLTFSNLWYNVDAVCNFVKIFREDTRLLMILPLHHVFAFAGALIAPFYAGSEIHIVETLTPECIIETLQRGKITLMLGVPRLYEGFAKGIMSKIKANPIASALYGLCSLIGSQTLSRKVFKSVHDKFGGEIEFFVSGGAALPMDTGKVFKNLGFYILDGYGMTECAPMISFTRPGNWHIGYCGLMLPGCDYKIEPSGELAVKGANVMKGYYNRAEETAQILRDGWLYTGDTATYDTKKGMKITGRIKEIIVTPNGKNINPAEIENEITASSTVIKELAVLLYEDKLQALVYPDLSIARNDDSATLDEMIRAEIESYNREAMGYKRIMSYQIISNELPKTRLGKTQRFKLEALMKKREEAPREDVSERSECFKALKKYVDELTGAWANGDSHFEIDLALDSLGRVSLLSYIEESFGVSISETELSQLSTLNLLSEYVEQRSESTTLSEGELSWREILETGDKPLTLPRSGALHWFMHNLFVLIFNVLFRFKKEGVKNIPEGAVLFVANHRSGFDGGFVSSKLPWSVISRTYFFAKEKHFKGGFRKFMARKNNVIVMNINTNVRESIQQMYQVLKSGKSIIIFPEGTRSKSGETQKFKESFAILSEIVNVPVVPIAITGSENATTKKLRLPRVGQKINVKFLPQITINKNETHLEFAERVRSSIVESL